MSGTLRDVYLFTTNGGCSVAGVEETSGGMSLDDKDGGLPSKQRKNNNNTSGNANIEWQMLLKDAVDVNVGSRSMFGDSDSGRFLNAQKFQSMGPVGAGGAWDGQRVEDRTGVVNYLQSFGPVSSGSNGTGVQAQLEEITLALDGHQQLLTNALRRSSSSCDVAAEATGGRQEEEKFGGVADSSSTITSHILQGNTFSSSAQHQQLFAAPRGLGMPSPASLQQLTRSPNHAIRNLFPEKSSNFSSAVLQSHDDLGVNKLVDEQVLLQLPKKARRQEYVDGGSVSSPLPRPEVDQANRLNHGGSSGQYMKVPFPHDQRGNSLAILRNGTSSYNKSSPTSFSSSFPPAEQSTGFNSSNISSLHNPSITLSNFQTTVGQLLPPKNSSHDGISMKSSLVDFGNYSLDSNRMLSGGGYRGELLVPERDSFLDVSSPQGGLSFMPIAHGQGPFNFSSRRSSSLDAGARGAWPPGLINNMQSRSLMSSRRTSHDREQSDGLLEDREARRVHAASDSRRRLLIQKQLTTTDVGSLGRIILPKKEAETHLPHLPDKEGIEMQMYDYEADRTWTMKYRFWPNNKSRMYLLENTGEFAKFHALQQGDWLYIYRDPVSRFVLRAKKTPPLLQVTPSSQSVTEPVATAAAGGPPAATEEVVGGPASSSVSGRTMNQAASPASTTDGGGSSSSKEIVCGTATAIASSSLDVPSSTFSLSSGSGSAGAACSGQSVVETKKSVPGPHNYPHVRSMPGTSNSDNKHPIHPVQSMPRALAAKASSADDCHHQNQHQELRVKNYLGVQQQQPDHEMPSELDEGGDFKFEDFPRLIDADDDTIDNFLGHSESHGSVDIRTRPNSLGGRGEGASSPRRPM